MTETTSGGEFSYTVLKDQFDGKPLIQQNFTSDGLSVNFEADMRAVSYSDMNTAVPVDISVTFADPWLKTYGDWNAQSVLSNTLDTGTGHASTVTAGKYTYDNLNGYTHVIGEEFFDPSGQPADKYIRYFDSAQNPTCQSIRAEC